MTEPRFFQAKNITDLSGTFQLSSVLVQEMNDSDLVFIQWGPVESQGGTTGLTDAVFYARLPEWCVNENPQVLPFDCGWLDSAGAPVSDDFGAGTMQIQDTDGCPRCLIFVGPVGGFTQDNGLWRAGSGIYSNQIRTAHVGS